MNIKKCKCAQHQVTFCGELIGSGQRKIDTSKVEVIEKLQAPSTKTELRQILGLFSFFREYIPRFAEIALSLTELTKKNVPDKLPWSHKHDAALRNLKQALCKAAQSDLTVVDFSKPYDIFVDASENVSGILTQQDAKKHQLHQLLSSVKN